MRIYPVNNDNSRIRLAGFALVICLAQLSLALIFAPHGQGPAYLKLNEWDSKHYLSIVENGYRMEHVPPTGEDVHADRDNVGFFPALPVLAQGIKKATSLSSELALLLTSQVFALVFWIYFLLLLGLRASRFYAIAAVAVYPSAFFLMAGYTESIFLAALLGMIYWFRRLLRAENKFHKVAYVLVAGLHGFLLSSSRLVGGVCALFPLIQILGIPSGEKLRREAPWALITVGLSMGGVLLFFGWCQIHFGQWNLYLKLQELGWGNLPNYWALLDPRTYVPHLFFEDTIDSISRASIPLTVGYLIYLWRKDPEPKERLGLYGVCVLMLFLYVSGKANAKFDSMIRYTLPGFTLLVLAHFEIVLAKRGALPVKLPARWKAVLAFSFLVQLWMEYVFLHGHWVA